MAHIKPIEIIASMSGKVCQHGDTYFATNKQTGRVYTGKLCNPSTAEPTAKQIQVRENFKRRAQNTSAWLEANKPNATRPKGTDLYQKALAAYKAQHQIGSFFGYIASIISTDGKVTIGGNTSGSGNSSGGGSSTGTEGGSSTGTGGGSSSGGGSGSGDTTPGGGGIIDSGELS